MINKTRPYVETPMCDQFNCAHFGKYFWSTPGGYVSSRCVHHDYRVTPFESGQSLWDPITLEEYNSLILCSLVLNT